MRIISGSAKGRRLSSPRGAATRPLTDRVREALFSSLGSLVHGARVLDLFAGTGSIGLEASSRGAGSVVFVERDRAALDVLRRNVGAVGLGGDVQAVDVDRFLERTDLIFDLVFVDPPYSLALASVWQTLERLEPKLEDGATVVVHRRWGEELPDDTGSLRLTDRRRYGDAAIWRFTKDAT